MSLEVTTPRTAVDTVRTGRLRARGMEAGRGLPSALRLRLARSHDDFEQAFRLLHDAYVGAGFTRPDPSGLRVTPYQALPNAVTVVALDGDVVIATVALIRRSWLGLPIEQVFDIKATLAAPRFAAEISGLAVHPAHRGDQRALLFALMRYVHRYARHLMGVSDLFLTCNPRHIRFYDGLLFQRLPGAKVDRYDFVDGAPAVGAHLDLRDSKERYFEAFERPDQPANLYRLFFEREHDLPADWPDRPAWLLSDNLWDEGFLRYFFCERTRAVERLSARERKALGLPAADAAAAPPSRLDQPAKVALQGTLRSALAADVEAVPVAVHAVSPHYVDLAGIPDSLELGVAELALDVPEIGRARAIVGPVTDRGVLKSLLILDCDDGWRRLRADIAARLPILGWEEGGHGKARRSRPLALLEAALVE